MFIVDTLSVQVNLVYTKMPQKTIQDLDAYIKATAAVYDHSNTKLVSRKTRVSRRRKEAFLSVLPYRKPSSHYHSHERKTSSSLITRKPRSKHEKESVISNPKPKLNISLQTPENANGDAPQTLSFQLDPETSVQSLKELIEKQIGVEARRQRLYTRRNVQLCDLLTLEENGVDKDEIISLRLSEDDENCDEVPKDKAAINDEYLKDLSLKIQSSWKEVAKHLGYEEAEIAAIQTTNEGSTEGSRHMLLTWWAKTTDRDEAAQKLRRALEAIGLTDLAQNVPVTGYSRNEAAGPEPERRQEAGEDEESKQNGAASTEEEKLKKERVGNQDKPRPICFRYVQVFIQCHVSHKRKTLCFRMNAETSVFTLKHMINEKISVQPQQQRLYIRRNFRNFELSNLLTLQDCGIHQDENISLRLCNDGLLGGGPTDTLPETTSVWNLSVKIGLDWEKLALILKFSKVQISVIKANHSNDTVRQCFEMLSTWWRKQKNYTEARQTLEKALIDSGRNDLVRDTSDSYDLFCWNKSEEIGVRWVALATQLAFTAEQIEIIQHDYGCSVEKQCFEMLTTWWRRQESDTQAKETLEKALKDMASSNPERPRHSQRQGDDSEQEIPSSMLTAPAGDSS